MEIISQVIWEKIVNILSEKFLVFKILNYASGVSPVVSQFTYLGCSIAYQFSNDVELY